MRRSFAVLLLSGFILALPVVSAPAVPPEPVVTSVAPMTVHIGQVLTLRGRNFVRHAIVYFRRASDGQTVRARSQSATATRIDVVVPPAVAEFLVVGADGHRHGTHFRIGVFARTYGPYTRTSQSPVILPAT